MESKPSQACSNLKQRVVQEDQVCGVGRVHQLVSSASHLIDQAFRLGFAMVRTPANRHYGYPGGLPGDRVQNLHKHDQREKKVFSLDGNDPRWSRPDRPDRRKYHKTYRIRNFGNTEMPNDSYLTVLRIRTI